MVSTKLIENAGAAAALLALLGNERRLVIMTHLIEGELPVGAIAQRVSLSQSALSQHLAKLRGLDLVKTRRERQMIFYSCNCEAVPRLFETLDQIFGNGRDSCTENAQSGAPVA